VSEYLEGLFGLAGRNAVVIGGTGVLGGRIASALAGAGARVIVAGRDAAKGAQRVDKIMTDGGAAEFAFVDVTAYQSLADLFAAAKDRLQHIDILVNSAGVNSATPYFEIDESDWDRILAINLKAVHYACQVFGRHMVERKTGSIINIASVSALVPLSRVFAYSASKSASVNYTRNLARELAPHGVRVNCISPGFVPAEQNRRILDADRTQRVLAHTPLGRFGRPEELDGAILVLASERAGSFITGANLVVDGGFSAQSI
jgi:NAD(P)-dependent dehydrogenase (short-subunit alcohol dehydrogenase family)